jgi:hypothetical protein
MITIKEVYDQLTKEELGTDKARVKSETAGLGTITGCFYSKHIVAAVNSLEFGICVSWDNNNIDLPLGGDSVVCGPAHIVEWIGNKPKAKKLYASLFKYSQGDGHTVTYWREEIKADAMCLENFIKWLPEDQYPPIEIS